MMKAPSVFLRSELTTTDIGLLMQWMADPDIRRYLNEAQNIVDVLGELSTRNMGALTPLFNQQGRFYLVHAQEVGALGFVRLVRQRQTESEMVIVIGDKSKWGYGYGKAAISAALRNAFFEERKNAVVANICADNIRSRNAFLHTGFSETGRSTAYVHYRLTMEEYLRRCLRGA